jgi:AbiV family abortive infection protein
MDKTKGLTQYHGPLTPAQAAAGIGAAIQNAGELLSDAELLLENKRWQRAAALAILSMEEMGKVPVLRGLLLARDERELRESWIQYRTHTKKNVLWIVPQLVAGGARKLEHFRPAYDESSHQAKLLDSVKQLAFYSDACGRCHWSLPREVVDSALAEEMVKTAKLLVGSGHHAFTTEAELQIWCKHMRPVWKTNMNEMNRGLLACYAEGEAKGVLQAKFTEFDMFNFLYDDTTL